MPQFEIINKEEFDNFLKKYIIMKNGNISSNAKRYGYFSVVESYIDSYQTEGNTTLEKLYLYVNKTLQKNCKYCGKKLKFKSWNLPYNIYCSKSCATKHSASKKTAEDKKNILNKSKETKLKRYGNKNFVNPEKAKETKIEKYGYISPFECKEIQDKIKETNIEKYGVERQLLRDEIQNKIKKTKLENYDNEYYNNSEKSRETHKKLYNGIGFKSKKILEKIKKTNIEKYGVENISQSYDYQYKKKIIQKNNFYKKLLNRWEDLEPLFDINQYEGIHYLNKYEWKCKICGTIFSDDLYAGRKPRCPTCYPYYRSSGEIQIINWLKSFDITIIENDKNLIKPYEIDIYLPEFNLGIEYNGLYWHSIKFINDKYYHQKKVKLANDINIRLLHIWEHEWNETQDLIKEVIIYYIFNLDENILPEKPKLYNIHNNLIWI